MLEEQIPQAQETEERVSRSYMQLTTPKAQFYPTASACAQPILTGARRPYCTHPTCVLSSLIILKNVITHGFISETGSYRPQGDRMLCVLRGDLDILIPLSAGITVCTTMSM